MSDQTSFRVFNAPGGQTVNGVSYCLDQTSGIFRPFYNTDFASSVSVSGLAIGNVAITGTVNTVDTIGNQLLSGISGALTTNLNSAVFVTGNVAVQVTGWNTGIIVTEIPKGTNAATNFGPSGAAPFTSATTFFGQALAANVNRNEMFVQNVHTGLALYVNLGATAAGTGSFSFILNPSTQTTWGGASYGSRSWKGAVQVSGGAWVAFETT